MRLPQAPIIIIPFAPVGIRNFAPQRGIAAVGGRREDRNAACVLLRFMEQIQRRELLIIIEG